MPSAILVAILATLGYRISHGPAGPRVAGRFLTTAVFALVVVAVVTIFLGAP